LLYSLIQNETAYPDIALSTKVRL